MSTSDNTPEVLEEFVKKSDELAEPQPIEKDCFTEMPTPMAMVDLVDGAGDRIALPYHALEEARAGSQASKRLTNTFKSHRLSFPVETLL